MLSKQETIELLRNPIYKVKLRLLYPPYTECDNVHIINGEWVDTRKPSIHQELFHYIHTKESVQKGEEYMMYNKRLHSKGCDEYYLQINDGEVHELDEQTINELEGIVGISTTSMVYWFTNKGLYKISNGPLSKEDEWLLKRMGHIE